MLRGTRIGLRARVEADVAILHRELHEDVSTRVRSSGQPWRPIANGPESPFRVIAPNEDSAAFSVIELDGDQDLVGDALLWGMDAHNRSAHLGLSLRPKFRGQGLASDVVQVLCTYGFTVRGLQRLQVDTLAENLPMIRTATRLGFVKEGLVRRSAWVDGEFVDEVILGLLADEWSIPTGGRHARHERDERSTN